MGKLNERQKRFADYYIKYGNAAKAARKSGYYENSAYKLMKRKEIKEYIEKRLKQMDDKRIADAQEVMIYLTSVMRGEATEEVVVIENCGGVSSANKVDKSAAVKERIKAAELLGKRYAVFTESKDENEKIPVVISGGERLEN
ncbi:MAG: terminase small subunit [Firmicutes bacterium]|nr:terminase small subunit [Bacillota bacterium]